MLVSLSPAKTLNFNCKVPGSATLSTPYFNHEAKELVDILKKYSAQEIAKLMKLSPKLSELNYERFQKFITSEAKPALFAYNGDVYDGFELEEYDEKILDFANQNLCIISGLYGVLRPLDLIKPYRLEMSTNLKNPYGKNLYNFWGEKITDRINSMSAEYLVNLASVEYSSAINSAKLTKKKIEIVFKEKDKVVGIYSKKARGLMANFIIRNKIINPVDLKDFNLNGYKFISSKSSEAEYVFVR